MSKTHALAKLQELMTELPSLKHAPYDHPSFQTWRLSVETLLVSHLGESHTITSNFRELAFKVDPIVEFNRNRDASQAEHQDIYLRGLTRAEAILNAAEYVWFNTAPQHDRVGSSKVSPVQVNLTNNNTANAQSNALANATSVVEFPVDDLLEIIDKSSEIPEEHKSEAKEVIENLDGELRKKNPRWAKVSGYLKSVADLGKELAIQTMAAVVAEYSKQRFGI